MSKATGTPNQNKAINLIVETITNMTAAGAVKNGMGATRLAKALKMTPEAVKACCDIAVARNRLVSGKGRGGSFRLAGVPHVQVAWGTNTGVLKGEWAGIHAETGKFKNGKALKVSEAPEAVEETDGAVS